MAIGIFKKKKEPTIHELVAEFKRIADARINLASRIEEIKRAAVTNGTTVDEVAATISRAELEASLHDAAQAEIRRRLAQLVDQQMRTTLAELDGRKAELRAEMEEAAVQAGVTLGSALGILRSLGQPFANRLVAEIGQITDNVLMQYAERGGLPVKFSAGMAEAPAPEVDFRREQRDLRAPFNGSSPGDPGWQRGIQKAVEKLLNPCEQPPVQRLFFYQGT